jgi:hypothetical protein
MKAFLVCLITVGTLKVSILFRYLEDFPPLSNTTPVISPPPGFENCNVPSSQTCDDNKSKKLDESEFPPPAWINDGTSTWKNVAEKPAWINDGTSTWKNVVEKPDDVPPTNSSNWVNDGTSTWKNVAKKFDENDFPPIGQPSINVVERPEEPKVNNPLNRSNPF